jgi:hypothetical protein
LRKRRSKAGPALIILIAALLAALYFVRPPGLPHPPPPEEDAYVPDILHEGSLPGITWADDVHPVFTRNLCVECHIRGFEAIAEGLEEFALGLIDPRDKNNAFWSYHELVYAEGPPKIRKGETLRDGQCCWPRGMPPRHQRRIWPGHPERSAIMRKLERDYFDWRNPPRFFEEGLALKWGLPMPMYHDEDNHEDATGGHEEPETPIAKRFEIRPFYERMLLHASLWLGGGRDELHSWPSRIPARDRAIIRYWISNSMQVMSEGTALEVEVVDPSGAPVGGAVVRLVGNYNSPDVRAVADEIAVETGSDGFARMQFPKYSVVTALWYLSASRGGSESGYVTAVIEEGKTTRARIVLPLPRGGDEAANLH